MSHFALVDKESNAIVTVMTCDEDIAQANADHRGLLLCACDSDASDTTHYWEGEKVVPKTTPPTNIEYAELSINVSGIPIESFVTVGGASVVADGQPLTIEFDLPGTYKIEIEPPIQYLSKTLEVTVNDDT